MTTTCTMILGDCLQVMPTLPRNNASLCLADLPYGNTALKWDSFDVAVSIADIIHNQFPSSCSVFHASVRLAAKIITEKPEWYRYDLVWKKTNAVGFFSAKKSPLRYHEMIFVFGPPRHLFNVIKDLKNPNLKPQGKKKSNIVQQGVYGKAYERISYQDNGLRFPSSVREVPTEWRHTSVHPTQKPVALVDWLIRTYSNPGDMVLDPVSGSFTTCVSACSYGRHSVGIEKDENYFQSGVERVRKHVRDNLLDVKLEVRR